MSEVFGRDMYLADQWLNTTIGGVGPEGLRGNQTASLAKLLGRARKEEYEGINSRLAHFETGIRELIEDWKEQATCDEEGWSYRAGNNLFNEGAAYVLRHGVKELAALLEACAPPQSGATG